MRIFDDKYMHVVRDLQCLIYLREHHIVYWGDSFWS